MKNTYIAIAVEDNKKYYAYAIKATEQDNLLTKLAIKGILHANICETRKAAFDLVTFWNDVYKKNGTYLFGDAPLF